MTKQLHVSNIKTYSQGRFSQIYVGRYATVAVNSDDGTIATAMRTGHSTVKKYGGGS